MIKTFVAPDGAHIVGILQTVQAIAKIEGIDTSNGDPIYTGDSEIIWETMTALTRRQAVIYVDDQGRHWTFLQLRQADGGEGSYARHRTRHASARRERLHDDADPEPSAVSHQAT